MKFWTALQAVLLVVAIPTVAIAGDYAYPSAIKVAGGVQIKDLPYTTNLSLEQTRRIFTAAARDYDSRLPINYGGGISVVKSEFNPATDSWDVYINVAENSEFPTLESFKSAIATPAFRREFGGAVLEASCSNSDAAKIMRACMMNGLVIRNAFFYREHFAGDLILDKNSFCPR